MVKIINKHSPKVLFITPHAFNNVTGGGITYTNLFKGWPKDHIATVHNDPEPTTTDVCDQYYKLGARELDFSFPFNYLRKSASNTSTSKQGTTSAQAKSSFKAKVLSKAKQIFLDIVGRSLPERATLSAELESWILDYKPDVIYTILGSNGMMELIDKIRVRFDLPVVIHIMDDWMQTSYKDGLFSRSERAKMDRLINHFMNVSTKHLGISHAMCEAYERRYGKSFEPFQNTIETNRWQHVAQDKSTVSTPVDLLYVGSIFPDAQLTSLINCCKVVADLNDSGFQINFTISSPSGHSQRYREKLDIHPAIKIVDTIRDDETFFNRISSSDILLLPVNFDESSIRFIRYSMPTKIPAYLTVGTPILVFGPKGLAQVDYAKNERWGYNVEQDDPALLKKALLKLSEDVDLRCNLSKTAKTIAQTHHDAKTVRSRFHTTLIDTI
ncbi:glycosyltransferase family 1 protein [Kiloniella majae]|uniref:glycosyltransferase family 1 protein n=1 Tax=Kiloniella majae TaxID=1938558 RepID=UPI000A2776D8|nr:glycosyltransferase family 1 protein [Kiloniella majae]